MKNKNSFIFKGLISLMLSLVMICGTAVTSLSAVTDQVVAAVKEPVRSAIPDAPAPAQAADETDIATQSDSSAADYGVAEGSMDVIPDDEVLDVDLFDSEPDEQTVQRVVSRKADTELAQTGALTEIAPVSAAAKDLAETGDQVGTVTLYFTNNKSWKNIYAYIWDSTDGGNGELSSWPGEAMNYVGLEDSNPAYAVYSVTVDTTKYNMIVFSGNNGSAKTTDIKISDAVSNGLGVKCSDNEYASAVYYPEYYQFYQSSTGLDHSCSYYIGKENSQKYILEPYGTNEWVIKNSNNGYLVLEGAGSRLTGFNWNASMAAQAAKWTFHGFDTAYQSLEGAIFTSPLASATVYILYTNDSNFTVQTNSNYRIAASLIEKIPSTYSVTVTKKSSTDNYNYYDDALAGVITVSYSGGTGTIDTTAAYGTVSNIPDGTEVTITAEASEGYTFLGWFTDESWVKVSDSVILTINGHNINLIARFSKKAEAASGTYKFTYDRRDIELDGGNTTWTKTVTRPLVGAEIDGYDGNGYNPGTPTYLYTSRAKLLFGTSPVLTASFAVQGNSEEQENASTYKRDITWPDMASASLADGITVDTSNQTVTVTATTTPYTFTLLYYTVEGNTATLEGVARDIEYGKAVTFNPMYSGSSEYTYVDYEVTADGFSYWSADEAGEIPITTNLTYGMIMRGDYTHDNDDDRTVHIYAQYSKQPAKLWNPLIEEAKLTHTIDDNVDRVFLDYMTNYLSKDGTVVQDMETKPEYGIVVAKYASSQSSLSQEKMERLANVMITGNKSSAYINSEHTAIAYRFHYNDSDHISDFNRVLYTLSSDTAKAETMQFTAIAYIVVDGVKYYSPINTDIHVNDLV